MELYRPNVGIIIFNRDGKLLWCKRKAGDGWQFPQGGIDANEVPEEAIFRETYEEVGITQEKLEIIKENDKWINYDVQRLKFLTTFLLKIESLKVKLKSGFLLGSLERIMKLILLYMNK